MTKTIIITALMALGLAFAPLTHAACPVDLEKGCKRTLSKIQSLAAEVDGGGVIVEITEPGTAVTAIKGQAPSQPAPPTPEAKEKLDAVTIDPAAP